MPLHHLHPAGTDRYSIRLKLTKALNGSASDFLAAHARSLLPKRNKRQVTFAVRMILYNAWLTQHYQAVFGALYGWTIVCKYSRREQAYKKQRRYTPADLSYSSLMDVIDLLMKVGLLDGAKGYRFEDTARQAWFQPTAKLIRLLSCENHRVEHQPAELILLKNEDKEFEDFQENEQIIEYRRVVKEINEKNALFDFCLSIPFEYGHRKLLFGSLKALNGRSGGSETRESGVNGGLEGSEAREGTEGSEAREGTECSEGTECPVTGGFLNDLIAHIKPTKRVPQPLATSLIDFLLSNDLFPELLQNQQPNLTFNLRKTIPYVRIFSRSSWTKNGRFYSRIQSMPAELRQFLIIAGQPVSVLDFSGMHIRMLYAQGGHACDGDPYSVGLVTDQPGVLRAALKTTLLAMINASSDSTAAAAVQQDINRGQLVLPHPLKPKDLIEALKRKHQRIAQNFCTDAGIDLMFTEAQIAEQVMMTFAAARKPLIGIHDGFVCKQRDEPFLRRIMIKAYKERLGFAPVIP